MQNEYITVTEFCTSHQVDSSFIIALANEGLIDITVIESSLHINAEQLTDLERYTRWQDEMGLSAEAIDIIHNLLNKIQTMQHEISYLRSRLSIYE